MAGLRAGSLLIPEDELRLSFSPSGGPGGQHANKASTRVILEWNVASSRAPDRTQRARLLERLSSRLDSSGAIRVVSDRYRSQMRNRMDARERLAALVARALHVDKKRVSTKPTRAAKQRRLDGKRRRSEIKRARRSPDQW